MSYPTYSAGINYYPIYNSGADAATQLYQAGYIDAPTPEALRAYLLAQVSETVQGISQSLSELETRVEILEARPAGPIPNPTGLTGSVSGAGTVVGDLSAALGILSLSSGASSLAPGVKSAGTIIGATRGSTISAAGFPTGFTINSAARTWAYDGTGAIVGPTAALTETLIGAAGSPRVSAISGFRGVDYTVNSAASPGGTGTPAAPFQTLGAALAAVGTASNKTIEIIGGHVSRENQLSSTAPGLNIVWRGSGVQPQILGSSPLTGPFTLVSGTKYTAALSYLPNTLAIVSGSGAITKLFKDQDSNVTPGEWAWASNVLTFDAGFDPTGCTLEVPVSGVTQASFKHSAANQVIQGVKFHFHALSGPSAEALGIVWLNSWASFNGDDGFDVAQDIGGATMRGGGAVYNGVAVALGSGPGDGFSAHRASLYDIEKSTFIGNTQTGVGNLADSFGRVVNCYFEDNYENFNLYNDTTGDYSGSHEVAYNIFVIKKQTSSICINNNNANSTSMVAKFYNNTIYSIGPTGAAWLIYTQGPSGSGYVDFRNNVGYTLANKASSAANYGTATVNSFNNIFYTAGGTSVAWFAGHTPTNTGNDILTNPLFSNAAAGDYTLQAGSPAIGSGLSLGYSTDYAGNPVPSTPDRGALQHGAVLSVSLTGGVSGAGAVSGALTSGGAANAVTYLGSPTTYNATAVTYG